MDKAAWPCLSQDPAQAVPSVEPCRAETAVDVVASASKLSAYVPPTAVDEEDRWALDPSAADDKQV